MSGVPGLTPAQTMSAPRVNAEKLLAVLPLMGVAVAKFRAELDAMVASMRAAEVDAKRTLKVELGLGPWSLERRQLLASMIGTVRQTEMVTRLNALPGRTLTLRAVKCQVSKLRAADPVAHRLVEKPPGAVLLRVSHVWTIERLTLVLEWLNRGERTSVGLRDAINALPGKTITVHALEMKLYSSGLRAGRFSSVAIEPAAHATPEAAPVALPPPPPPIPPKPTPAVAPDAHQARGAALRAAYARGDAAKRAAPVKAEEPPPPPARVVADLEQIRGFAAGKGWPTENLDLADINARLEALGAPIFVLGVRRSREQVAKWAIAQMGHDAPLFAVNRAREQRGQPLFMVREG